MIVLWMILALVIGVSATMQPTLNTSLSSKVGLGATLVLNGALVLALSLIYYFVTPQNGKPGLAGLTEVTWYECLGGPFGFCIVILSVLLFPRLGAGLTFALAIFAQFFLAALVDHYGLFGMPRDPLTVWRIVGLCFLALGAGILKLA